MGRRSQYKGEQKGRCTNCSEKFMEKAENGKYYKWCDYYGKYCRYVAWNCTVHYVNK